MYFPRCRALMTQSAAQLVGRQADVQSRAVTCSQLVTVAEGRIAAANSEAKNSPSVTQTSAAWWRCGLRRPSEYHPNLTQIMC